MTLLELISQHSWEITLSIVGSALTSVIPYSTRLITSRMDLFNAKADQLNDRLGGLEQQFVKHLDMQANRELHQAEKNAQFAAEIDYLKSVHGVGGRRATDHLSVEQLLELLHSMRQEDPPENS